MKKYFLCFLILAITARGWSQKAVVDSLTHLIAHEERDTSKVLLLASLSQCYTYDKIDTALSIAGTALELARQIKYKQGEATALLFIGQYFEINGNYSEALEAALGSSKITENIYNPELSAAVDHTIGNIYWSIKDYRNSLTYFFKERKVAENLNNSGGIATASLSIGDSYEKLNLLDSAILFTQQAYTLADRVKDSQVGCFALANLGNIYAKFGQDSMALGYYQKSLPTLIRFNFEDGLSEAALGAAMLFKKKNAEDSALTYAKLSLLTAQHAESFAQISSAANFLSGYYEQLNKKDSAYLYQRIAMKAKDGQLEQRNVSQSHSFVYEQTLHQQELAAQKKELKNEIRSYILIVALVIFLGIAFILWRHNIVRKKAYDQLQSQKQEIDFQKTTIENTLVELKSTQSQLIQSEKMASLGELTAGIAHEIQNPLNFVNNFSEVSNELISEIQEERNKEQGTRDEQLQDDILNDIKQNLEKINHHGKRADAIVKGMLQHSRSSTGVKESTNINALADEYLRLAYHGLRAKDKDFNATLKTDFDNSIEKINVIPQDIGRVLLNLYTNAFYAVGERKKAGGLGYEPTITVATKKSGNQVFITVSDNGNGIPQKIVDKIFQPFFTTKPTGQGTGLGLSLSYDIISAHGGEIKLETKEGEGSKFVIELPIA